MSTPWWTTELQPEDRLPMLPWWVRLSVWSANYPRPSSGFPPMPRKIPPDVECMVWGCEEKYIVRSWRQPVRKIQRPGCIHRSDTKEDDE